MVIPWVFVLSQTQVPEDFTEILESDICAGVGTSYAAQSHLRPSLRKAIMSDSYSGDKILSRQRVCAKCRSFVTLDRINDKQYNCPLCGQKLNAYVDYEAKISTQMIRDIVRRQHQQKRAKRS